MVYSCVVACGVILLFVMPDTPRAYGPLYGFRCKLRKRGHTGVCRSITDCPSALYRLWFNKERPEICSSTGYKTIICCDDYVINDGRKPQVTTEVSEMRSEGNATAPRRSSIACMEYSRSCPTVLVPLIENGENATMGEFGHMVLLGYENGSGINWGCGGSLISDMHVLTAGHCAYNAQGKTPVLVRAGDLDISTDEDGATPVDIMIEDIVPHPEYEPPTLYHDLAIFKLKEKVTWNKNVFPACLHTENEIPRMPLLATGWGQTSFFGEKSTILQKVMLEYVPLQSCNESYRNRLGRELPNGLQSSMLCAGDPEGLRDACYGDSGGPLQYRVPYSSCSYSIVGVISSGATGCASSLPGIYIRVSEHLDWIESVVWH